MVITMDITIINTTTAVTAAVTSYVYSQPPGYYQPYYPQPRYNYYNNYYPAPIYTLPPQMMMGIGTGNMDFYDTLLTLQAGGRLHCNCGQP